ncbi:MAG: hypothetical protein WDA75_05620, partial [Candidatus Latescibacterota bacterium]
MASSVYQLSAAVPAKSVQYLKWLGQTAETCGGARIPKAAIVRALLNVAMRLEIDVTEVTTEQQLEERIWGAIERRGGR